MIAPQYIPLIILCCCQLSSSHFQSISRPLTEITFVPDSPNSTLLVSAAHDKLPQIRNGESGDWIGTFQGHKGAGETSTLVYRVYSWKQTVFLVYISLYLPVCACDIVFCVYKLPHKADVFLLLFPAKNYNNCIQFGQRSLISRQEQWQSQLQVC